MEENIINNNKKTVFKFQRYIFLTFMIAFGSISIIATGGGREGGDVGETTTSPNTAPSITNLAYVSGCGWGGTITVTGSVDFTDDDGNVSILIINIFDSIANINHKEVPLEGIYGETSGTIPITFSIDEADPGDYSFELYLMDTDNLESNTLTGKFSVS